jgi:hypothetical protein
MTTAKLTTQVKQAIEEIRKAFAGHSVDVEPDNDGGAYVTVDSLFLGDQFVPSTSWIGFHITYQYPHAGIYPHHTAGDLMRADGQALGEAIHQGREWKTPSRTRSAMVFSRKSHGWDASRDTAAVKLQMVLEWIRTR